ncbi:BREX-1 system adenine-specific DNA-methyltransferase PglX [Aeromonas rivipollensis]|uniref:BREX-1 system adenine-specific DNA-methyltransferase PglX n=1 Tax=Aeromonas rivipollensis TaxID=948519 RepID=UPI003D1D99B2
MSQQDNKEMAKHFYRASAADFGKIPGSPIAYWVSNKIRTIFAEENSISQRIDARQGLGTGADSVYFRFFWEVSFSTMAIGFPSANEVWKNKNLKWIPLNKGGSFRKWSGNRDFVIAFDEASRNKLKEIGNHLPSEDRYFKSFVSWSDITSATNSFRYFEQGYLFSNTGHCAFPKDESESFLLLAYCNNRFVDKMTKILNPTIHFHVGYFNLLPYPTRLFERSERLVSMVRQLVEFASNDWISYENTWDFRSSPLLVLDNTEKNLRSAFQKCCKHWLDTTLEMQRLEEENNRLFIDAYGLQDELTPEVPLSEITLTCNPHYRYGGNLTDEEREARLQSDTLAELISYAIGCMMGRYSLDREGLVYAHAGNEGFKALVEEGAYSTFAADEDGILPLTSDNWFPDDVAARFEAFIRTVWGAETLEENLQFIADSLCLAAIKPVKKGGETARETIRRYLSTQFFKDHLKTYKKRPIYWLFSSGKEKAFECLVYLHRYNEATLPRMRTEYVTPLLGQMAGRIDRLRLQQAEAGTAEAKRIGKEIDTLSKQLTELRAFDDELKHHADMRIRLDLDDGVKVNYGKFGTLLSDVKAITGDKGE